MVCKKCREVKTPVLSGNGTKKNSKKRGRESDVWDEGLWNAIAARAMLSWITASACASGGAPLLWTHDDDGLRVKIGWKRRRIDENSQDEWYISPPQSASLSSVTMKLSWMDDSGKSLRRSGWYSPGCMIVTVHSDLAAFSSRNFSLFPSLLATNLLLSRNVEISKNIPWNITNLTYHCYGST